MGTPDSPKPVRLIAGLLVSSLDLLDEVHAALVREWGTIAQATEPLRWTFTSYYANEMGEAIWRQFLAFSSVVDPGALVDLKLKANGLEDRWRSENGRRVNIDPGYVAPLKLVLGTTKDAAHRLYLGRGIHAEVTLVYDRGTFRSLPHTYADYATSEAIGFFNEVRNRG